MDPLNPFLAFVFCALVGGFFSAVSVSQWRRWRRIVRGGIPASATITRVEYDSDWYWTTVEFSTEGVTRSACIYGNLGKVGDVIPLLVDPADHSKAITPAQKSGWGCGFVLMFSISATFDLCALITFVQFLHRLS